ncbi:hypothetical protein [Enterococcus sp. DIV0800]|uniref:hypothetical protein n=1 Tax=unclassified Enterococcus TaxID=2608891 RepID=UPI003D2FB0D6
MARCKPSVLLNKIGNKKLDATTETSFAVLTDADSCVKLNTRNFFGYKGESVTFNQYNTPDDLFSCLAEDCKNSGTLRVTNTTGTKTSATFLIPSDATEYFAGVVTYYVDLPGAGTYELETTLSDLKDTNQTDADVYTHTITAENGGFYPCVVDLTQLPTSQEGSGWMASENGLTITIALTPPTEESVANFGFSSIYVYDTSEDFEVNDVVKLGCLDELAGDDTIDPADATCFGSGYDPNSISVERSITAKKATPNYWKLNPLMSRGHKTKGWFLHTVEREVTEVTKDGICFGMLQFPDMDLDECAFTKAAIADNCNVTDAELNRVNSPVIMALSEKQFILLDGKVTNSYDAGMMLFHESMIGRKVIVSYPKQADVEHFVADESALTTRRVRASYEKIQTDGVRKVYIFNNVLITSFPQTINGEETTFEFTLSIQRDRNNRFYEVFRITE